MAPRSAALALTLLLAICGCMPAPRYLVLISVDTLRADHLGCYGGGQDLTPRIDALAEGSDRFTAAYAPTPFTLPSVAALMTGRYPEGLGMLSNKARLPESVPTLATRLRERGWRTGAVVSSAVLKPRRRLDRGFDRYDADLPQREARRGTPERTAGPTTDAAIRMLDVLRDGEEASTFLWIHYQDPHGPYQPPEGLRARYLSRERASKGGRVEIPVSRNSTGIGAIPVYQYIHPHREAAYYRAGYAGEVRYLDGEIGRLLDALDERGALDDSVIVFTADHGESLGEDDYWFAHGEHLTDASVRVPLLIRVPGRPGAKHDAPVSLVDVVPTLAALFDLDLEGPLSGSDLLGRRGRDPERAVYMSTGHPAALRRRAGVVTQGYKLIRSQSDAGPEERLYRLPDEAVNLVQVEPELHRALADRLDALIPEPVEPAVEPRLSAEDRDHLSALGYGSE